MLNKFSLLPLVFFSLLLLLSLSTLLHAAEGLNGGVGGCMVKREERKSLAETDFGKISAVNISNGPRLPYYLQFITLEPNALFLPVLLHAGMVFYVSSGSGRLSWTDEDDLKRVQLKRGDVFRLQPGTVFFVESNLELDEREKLRIYAMFSNTDEEAFEPTIGSYTSISDLVLGFDNKVLASAFKVPEDVIEEIRNATKPAAMVHALPKEKTKIWQLENRILKAFLSDRGAEKRNNKMKTFNILHADPDFKNCNGWSITVNKKDFKPLKHTNIGIFMVNLTKGSMMVPHWNPMAGEIAIVLQGQGMVQVVCPSTAEQSDCKDTKFRVGEGDVFAVPRFHPMAQMSFNNDSFVFMGFSTAPKKNHPQFLAGKNSILHAIERRILALSFNVTNMTTIDWLLTPQKDLVILDCTSCAEEEERAMEEEIREEEKEREEEETRKREEEEKKKREDEEEKKREEEAARKKEEEEEAARKREEEEEEKKKKEDEEEKKREEEAARKRKEEEEEASRKREEEEAARKREEEKEEAARKREEEEEEKKKREDEEEKKREEEAARKRKEEEEAARKREEEEAARKREEEEEAARKREEEAARKRAEEEAKKREEEEARKKEEEKREREEARRREEEAEREQEEARKQEKEREQGEGEGEGGGGREEQPP